MNEFCSGIHVLVKKGNKYLILKRSVSDNEDPNYWDLPGGGIKFGEQPSQAAVREAKEEAGVKVKVLNILGLWAIPYKGEWSIESIAFTEYVSGEVRLSDEHNDYKWVDKQTLSAIKPKSISLKALIKYCQGYA